MTHDTSMAPDHSECLDAYRKMQEAKTQRQKDKDGKATKLSAEDKDGNANKKEFSKNVSAKSDDEE